MSFKRLFFVACYLFLSVSSRMGRFRLRRLGAKHIRNRAFLSGRLIKRVAVTRASTLKAKLKFEDHFTFRLFP